MGNTLMDDQPRETFSQALRRYRLAAGLSQEALAARSGLSARGISDLERGERRFPHLETVRKLAQALELDESVRAELILASRPPVAASSSGPSSRHDDGHRRLLNTFPQHATPLFGREREAAGVRALLRRPETRMVTLTGPGGAGKTRLAAQVATELHRDYEDGAVFVPLAPLSGGAQVIPTIAETLDVREVGEGSLHSALNMHLRERHMLLVLDNFEHVLDAAPFVSELLAHCPRLGVIVTSRAPLRLHPEHVVEVTPLAVPDAGQAVTIQDIASYGALELFVDRAQMATSRFAVTSENVSEICEICRQLDGLPLAIELAAVRMRVLSLRDLALMLQRRLPVLDGGLTDLPQRHQALRTTIEWSYQLLSEEDQQVFRRLAVFSGGWTLEAAAAVVGAPDAPLPILNSIETLVDNSLVRRVNYASETSRFDMLETIREYGLEQLEQHGDAEQARESHARYLLALVTKHGSELSGMNVDATRCIEVEYDNVRAAIQWSLDRRNAAMALSLCSTLHEFWTLRGHFSEGRAWLDAALGLDGDAPLSVRAAALNTASGLACYQADLDHATQLAQESLELARRSDDRFGVANALHSLGLCAQLQEEYEHALHVYEECIALQRCINHKRMTWTIGNLAQVVFQLGDVERAVELFDECIALDRASGNLIHHGLHLTDLGLILLVHGDDERARTRFNEALRIHREIGHVRMTPITIEGLAALAARNDEPEQAARLYGAAEALRETIALPLEDPDEWQHARHVDLARARLGDDAFVSAWAAGREMGTDEAVEYALKVSTAR